MNRNPYRVLIVDDDEAISCSLQKLLNGEGYEVILAANGAEAMDVFRREQGRVDLSLVDLNMPVKNGWVAINQLVEAKPKLPVFVLTGLSQQAELAKASGVRALVEKPIDVEKLLWLISEQFAESRWSPTDSSGQPELSFQHLQAANYVTHKSWNRRAESPYSHWGLNE